MGDCMNSAAVLMTCFNRKEKTIKCLNKLHSIKKDIDVYLVDDGSSDGTSDAVAKEFPSVNIIKGSGALFWNRGMCLAWKHAGVFDYDYYVWLNDDVVLYDNCFDEVVACSVLTDGKSIISGVIDSHDGNSIIYGGSDKNKKLIMPNGQMKKINNMNGNFVLIPRHVYHKIGNLDPLFHHDLGDVDYGLRAIKNNIDVLTTRVSIGSCDVNNFCRVRFWGVSLNKRFKKLYSPIGSNPKINFIFRKRHFGLINAISYYLFLHIINILPDGMIEKIFNNKYKNS